jgi:transcriptional regulator with XRE-family HTH domain
MLGEMSKVGEFFKGYRDTHKLSYRQLAEQLGVAHSYIAHAEDGKIELPFELIKKLWPLLNDVEQVEMTKALKFDHDQQLIAMLKELKE